MGSVTGKGKKDRPKGKKDRPEGKKMTSATRTLRPYLAKEWHALAGSAVSTIAMSATDLASPWPLALASHQSDRYEAMASTTAIASTAAARIPR